MYYTLQGNISTAFSIISFLACLKFATAFLIWNPSLMPVGKKVIRNQIVGGHLTLNDGVFMIFHSSDVLNEFFCYNECT